MCMLNIFSFTTLNSHLLEHSEIIIKSTKIVDAPLSLVDCNVARFVKVLPKQRLEVGEVVDRYDANGVQTRVSVVQQPIDVVHRNTIHHGL
jgi:hypothetical protein